MKTDPEQFILANTSPLHPPHVPEVRLHLASEAHDLWLKTEEELEQIGLPPPFWAFAWAGGQGMARFILDNPVFVRDKHVVDFATGSGLVAIAAMKAGAAGVTAVDVDPWCESAVRLNATLNRVAVCFCAGDIIGRPVEADILLAGDVFYDRAFAERLVPWLGAIAASRPVLVGDPGRSYLPRQRLRHLETYNVPVTRALEDAEVKKTSIFQFLPDPTAG